MRFKKLKAIKDKICEFCGELWKSYVEFHEEYPIYFVSPIFSHHHFMYYDYIRMLNEKRRRETYGNDVEDSRNC